MEPENGPLEKEGAIFRFQTLGVQKGSLPRSTPLVLGAPESEGGTGGKEGTGVWGVFQAYNGVSFKERQY